MKLISRIALLASAAVLLPVGAAMAADYDPPIVVDEAPEYVPVEIGSGWYLRGDVGYIFKARIGQVDYRTYDGFNYGNAAFDTQSIGTDFSWGGGVGYRFNEWIRADATVEGFRASFAGTTSSATPCIDPLVDPLYLGTTCRSEDSSEFSAIGVMANGYVDLGTFVGLTPYVGAGIGYSYVSWGGLNNQTYCVDGGGVCPQAGVIATSEHAGDNNWRLTYALMAGFAYDINDYLKVDLGYKYRHVAGGGMFHWDAATAGLGATGIQGTDGGFDTHEVKLGLRYELW